MREILWVVVRVIVVVVEELEERLWLICLEMLVEILVCDFCFFIVLGGLVLLYEVFVDGLYKVLESLIVVFFYFFDVLEWC